MYITFKKNEKKKFNRLNPSLITDNKFFWRVIKPLFSEKCFTNENITLIEKNEIIEDDNKISEIFNDFFTNAVKNLNIEIDQNILNNVDDIEDPILKAIKKYQKHPSILKINENQLQNKESFEFKTITQESLLSEINILNAKKATQIDNIPIKIINGYRTNDFTKRIVPMAGGRRGVEPASVKSNFKQLPVSQLSSKSQRGKFYPLSNF